MAISEREKVIDKLEEMLKFFRDAEIKNDNSLININEQLDDVISLLKYVPSEPSFDSLPREIKTDILNHLCDAGAFIAVSVSQEWMQILERNLKQVDKISLGRHCSNGHKSPLIRNKVMECEDMNCFMPEEFLRAEMTHNLDIPLFICHPLGDIDTELFVEGLSGFSNLSIEDDCCCPNDFEPSISFHQLQALFEEFEGKGKIMDTLQLIGINLTGLNPIKLVNYLLNKVKNLTLFDCGLDSMFKDNELFIEFLLQITTESQLSSLTIRCVEYPDSEEYPNLSRDFADALCKVPSVVLSVLPIDIEKKIAKRLFRNIRTQNIRMKNFELEEDIDWRGVLSPGKLKKTLEKMDTLKLVGNFTAAQVEAAKSLPGIEANFNKIFKCSI